MPILRTPRLILRLESSKESPTLGEVLFNLYLPHEPYRPVGSFGFHTWYPQHCRAELGYHLAPHCRGLGLAREALPPVLEYGFVQMELNRVEALVPPDNAPSLALLRWAGFREEGRLRQAFLRQGSYRDALLLSLLRGEWQDRLPTAPQTDS